MELINLNKESINSAIFTNIKETKMIELTPLQKILKELPNVDCSDLHAIEMHIYRMRLRVQEAAERKLHESIIFIAKNSEGDC